MKRLECIVRLSHNCFYNILRNIAEMHKNESLGDLIGRKNGRGYFLENASPNVTAESSPNYVWAGNDSARKRIVELDKAIKMSGSKYSVVGQYHTHVYREDEMRAYIGEKDIEFFRGWARELGLEECIQLVAAVRVKNYKKKQRTGERTRYYGYRARVIFKSGEFFGHDVIIAGYILTPESISELKVRRANLGLSRKINRS